MGREAVRDGTGAALSTGRRRGTGGEMEDDKEGQETDVMSDTEVRATDDAAAQQWTINNSD